MKNKEKTMDIQHKFFVKYLLYPITLFMVVTADTSPKVRKGYPMPHKGTP